MATIEQEAAELKNAPVIIPVVGMVERCHICGAVMGRENARVFDIHIKSRIQRKKCRRCSAR